MSSVAKKDTKMLTPFRKLTIAVAMVAVLAGFMAGPAAAQDPDAPSIGEVAAADGQFSTLVTAAQLAGLSDTIADCDAGPLTVLAPTDDAFAAALSALNLEVTDLVADPDLLTALVSYHVLDGAIPSEVVLTLDGASAPTLQGEDITVSVDGDAISIVSGNPVPANVTAADIQACNGIIHVIDNVLLPPTVAESLGLPAPAAEEEPAAEEPAETEAAQEDLAETGSNSLTLAVIAVTLMAAGGLVVVSSRRLRTLD